MSDDRSETADPWTFLDDQLWARVDDDGDVWLAVFPENPSGQHWMVEASAVAALRDFLVALTSKDRS